MTSPLRIAVADDELDMRDFFLRILSRRGHQVVSVAETGRELVQHCRELKPDLVITDVKMPEMDGIEAAQAICSERTIPIILVSAHYDGTTMPPMDRPLFFLRKPFASADLEAIIVAAVRSMNHPPDSTGVVFDGMP